MGKKQSKRKPNNKIKRINLEKPKKFKIKKKPEE